MFSEEHLQGPAEADMHLIRRIHAAHVFPRCLASIDFHQ